MVWKRKWEILPKFVKRFKNVAGDSTKGRSSTNHVSLAKFREDFQGLFSFPYKSKAWIRDLISVKEDMFLESKEEEDFNDLTTNGGLQIVFKEKNMADLCAYVSSELKRLANKALQTLISFPATYFSKQYFSSLL